MGVRENEVAARRKKIAEAKARHDWERVKAASRDREPSLQEVWRLGLEKEAREERAENAARANLARIAATKRNREAIAAALARVKAMSPSSRSTSAATSARGAQTRGTRPTVGHIAHLVKRLGYLGVDAQRLETELHSRPLGERFSFGRHTFTVVDSGVDVTARRGGGMSARGAEIR